MLQKQTDRERETTERVFCTNTVSRITGRQLILLFNQVLKSVFLYTSHQKHVQWDSTKVYFWRPRQTWLRTVEGFLHPLKLGHAMARWYSWNRLEHNTKKVGQFSNSSNSSSIITRKPCYRKDDRAMRPIYTYKLFTLIFFTLRSLYYAWILILNEFKLRKFCLFLQEWRFGRSSHPRSLILVAIESAYATSY